MNSCSIVSQASKPNIKTVLNTICLIFIFFVSANTVGAIASPDLIVQTIAADKTTLETGESFEIQARLWNQGTAVSGATTLRYCLSTDDTISLSDTEVGSDPVDALSGRGASAVRRRVDLSQTLTAPDTPGVHYYGVCIDALTDEADTTNNCSQAIAITVEAPPPDPVESAESEPIVRPEAPDLLISADRVDRSTISQGQGVRLHITLTNQGMRAAPATTIRFYRSLDATISAEDTELRAVPVSGLGPGRSYTTWALLPSPFAVGVYYYGACLDAVASEFDTTNNCSDAIEITIEAQGTGTQQLFPSGTIETQSLDVGGSPIVLDVSGNFFGNVESYTASSSDTSAVTVSLSGSEVTLTPVSEGWARVTIQASSGDLAAQQTFSVSVGGVAVPEPAVREATVRDTTGPEIPDISGPDTSPEVSIPDAGLRQFIRSALGLEEGDTITQQKMAGLTRLYAQSSQISDLTGLEHATSLSYLFLEVNSISDISALSGLTSLTRLSLDGNSISDISALSGLTSLTFLTLEGNTISDISAVSGLTSLTFLSLSANTISDISAVSGLTSLTTLSFEGNTISDISAVSGLTSLSYLHLTANTISDISAVSGLTSLKGLYLFINTISDISAVSGLTSLRDLSLEGNTISDISAVSGLTSLIFLSLSDNTISDISAVSGLTSLTLLYLHNNTISDVSAVSGLTSLTELSLSGNSITDLAPLRTLKANNPSVDIDIDINPIGGAPSLPVLPAETALLSNYPNPFNPETWIPYQLAKSADVTLTIYDIKGREVRRLALGHRPAGFYRSRGRAAHWDGRNQIGEKVATGLYFYTLTTGEFTATGKMLIQK